MPSQPLMRPLLACFALACLSGCMTRGGDIPYGVSLATPDFGTRDALPADVALGPSDRIRVTVFRVPELSAEYRVGADGFVSLPLLGAVDMRNVTASEAGDLLAELYGRTYLRDPKVTVSVLESTQRTFTVEGGVRTPGVYPLAGKTDLLSAVAAAHGVDADRGNDRRVAILRKINGQQMVAAFDLRAVRNGTMINPEVYPADIVVVQSDGTRQLFRDILTTLPALAVFNPLRTN